MVFSMYAKDKRGREGKEEGEKEGETKSTIYYSISMR